MYVRRIKQRDIDPEKKSTQWTENLEFEESLYVALEKTVVPPVSLQNASDSLRGRLLIDAQISTETAAFFSSLGYDAVRAKQILPRVSDETLFQYAIRDKRIIITYDKDFLNFDRFSLADTQGIVHIQMDRGNSEQTINNPRIRAAAEHFAACSTILDMRSKALEYDRQGMVTTFTVIGQNGVRKMSERYFPPPQP